MIVKGIILIILIFGALVFLAIKMSESIVKAELKMFFFGLFFVTIITVFNILLSVYFIIKAKDKTGPRGRKGLKGTIGEPGEDGVCHDSCQKNSIHQMIINKLESIDDLQGGKRNLDSDDMKKLCDLKSRLKSKYTLEELESIESIDYSNILTSTDLDSFTVLKLSDNNPLNSDKPCI